MSFQDLAEPLARALEAGALDAESVAARAAAALGRPWPFLQSLARRYVEAFAGKARPRHSEVVGFLRKDAGLIGARAKLGGQLRIVTLVTEAHQMRPATVAANWPVRPIESPAALADWLGLELGELLWFADRGSMMRRSAKSHLQHYRYRVFAKRSGGLRLIEAPKPRLKNIQRHILSAILNAIPLHDAAHGFRRGRSTQTFVAPHIGQRALLRMDLVDFFPSIAAGRVQALFRTMGYPEAVADSLAGLCTNTTPRSAWRLPGTDPRLLFACRDLYARPHLPQGAPTSPALANACAYRLDCRLTGLARAAGAQYTRYADDLAFSGDGGFARGALRFADHVGAVLIEEGFEANYRKTRVMRAGTRQQLAGLVANERVNTPRDDFDRLKATLTNCARHGAASQNRESDPAFRQHLEGRMSYVAAIHPARGDKLRKIFDQIDWNGL